MSKTTNKYSPRVRERAARMTAIAPSMKASGKKTSSGEACRNLAEIVGALPDGYSRVAYRQRRYGLTVTRFNDRKSVKIYAEELGGQDAISANCYFCRSGFYLMPCEMAQARVNEFLQGFEFIISAEDPR